MVSKAPSQRPTLHQARDFSKIKNDNSLYKTWVFLTLFYQAQPKLYVNISTSLTVQSSKDKFCGLTGIQKDYICSRLILFKTQMTWAKYDISLYPMAQVALYPAINILKKLQDLSLNNFYKRTLM